MDSGSEAKEQFQRNKQMKEEMKKKRFESLIAMQNQKQQAASDLKLKLKRDEKAKRQQFETLFQINKEKRDQIRHSSL